MIVLLGSSGYVGSRFCGQLQRLGIPFARISSSEVDIYDPIAMEVAVRKCDASFLINCAGFTGKPNVDACEKQKTVCLKANAVLPGLIAEVCGEVGIPFGHISSGCIFTGRTADGAGFREQDEPNFSFRQNNCSFYSGTKALGEEILAGNENCYIWRLRMPFDNSTNPRNYLQKVMSYDTLLEAENSLSQLDEFVTACIDSITLKIPYGIYNVNCPGSVKTSDVLRWIEEAGLADGKTFRFFRDEAEFMKLAGIAPRANCVMDSSKAIGAGLKLTPVEDAIRQCLRSWGGVSQSVTG